MIESGTPVDFRFLIGDLVETTARKSELSQRENKS
jgi:hypothetical protein